MGYMTTYDNIESVVQLIKRCYCNKERIRYLKKPCNGDRKREKSISNGEIDDGNQEKITDKAERKIDETPKLLPEPKLSHQIKLQEICIYPIKSCGPFRIDTNWPLNSRGFVYDREWMIVKASGIALTQKSEPKLCLIQPVIDEYEETLTLNFPYADSISIPLKQDTTDNRTASLFCQSKVCGDRIDGIDCGNDVAEWLSDVLNTPRLRLIQQNADDARTVKNDATQAISLSNQAQFLLINVASVSWLTQKVENWAELDDCAEKVLQNTIDRFRANLIVDTGLALDEMKWTSIRIGGVKFNVTGPCTRCQMICIDQSTGEKTTEPLQTIAREFQGKMRFGIYLSQADEQQQFDDGSEIGNISCSHQIVVEKLDEK